MKTSFLAVRVEARTGFGDNEPFMFGLIIKFMIAVIVLVGAAVLFEFRWTGDELRIRNRWSSAPVKAEAERAKEEIPEESRQKLKDIIEENSR
jgi:hypothetical protein